MQFAVRVFHTIHPGTQVTIIYKPGKEYKFLKVVPVILYVSQKLQNSAFI